MQEKEKAVEFLSCWVRSSFGSIGGGLVKSITIQNDNLVIVWNNYNGKDVTRIEKQVFTTPYNLEYTKQMIVDIYNQLVDLESSQMSPGELKQPHRTIDQVDFNQVSVTA